jgi:hypothetical protein
MKILVLFLAGFFMLKPAHTQTATDSVKAAINALFDGMKNVDPELIRNSFTDSAFLQTIARSADGKTIVRNESIAQFANSIAKQAKGALDEQIQFGSINIDGDLASVWTPYKFFFSGKLSHCGVNSFQLVRLNGGWKIQYLIDTRRRNGCE